MGTLDRGDNFISHYFRDVRPYKKLREIGGRPQLNLTVDGARNVPYSDAVSRHGCGCNKPIGN